MELKITKTTAPKAKPVDENNLPFGKTFTDHLLIIDYTEGIGWHDGRIVPYGPIEMDPATTRLHYGQAVFEGLKAYRCPDGKIRMFRPDRNMARLNVSNDRLCIPQIDEEEFTKAVMELVNVERDWVPSAPNTSLYIRPFIFATDVFLGVHPSHTYKFMVILSPVGPYYAEGLNPVKIYVEDEYVRAVRGGMGFAKAAGNYAVSLKGQVVAGEKGYSQVLWLDGIERKYIEEVGAMNIFFKINGEVVTPALNGSILPGITRDSVINVLKSKNIPVSEKRISIDEIIAAYENGTLEEVFGTGTAAVISPVGELCHKGKKMVINNGEIGEVSQMLYDTITGIQSGVIEDSFNWTRIVE